MKANVGNKKNEEKEFESESSNKKQKLSMQKKSWRSQKKSFIALKHRPTQT